MKKKNALSLFLLAAALLMTGCNNPSASLSSSEEGTTSSTTEPVSSLPASSDKVREYYAGVDLTATGTTLRNSLANLLNTKAFLGPELWPTRHHFAAQRPRSQ